MALLSAGTAGLAYPCWVEPRWLDVTRRRVRLGRTGPAEPVRVLHLSDLHASRFVSLRMIADAIALGLAEKPDIVCLTGDYISHRDDTPAISEYARVLRALSAAAPAFAVMGNHDGGSWARRRFGWSDHRIMDRVLEESGIELLHNRSRTLVVRGRKLALAGVGDQWSDETDTERAFAGVDSRLPSILLAIRTARSCALPTTGT